MNITIESKIADSSWLQVRIREGHHGLKRTDVMLPGFRSEFDLSAVGDGAASQWSATKALIVANFDPDSRRFVKLLRSTSSLDAAVSRRITAAAAGMNPR